MPSPGPGPSCSPDSPSILPSLCPSSHLCPLAHPPHAKHVMTAVGQGGAGGGRRLVLVVTDGCFPHTVWAVCTCVHANTCHTLQRLGLISRTTAFHLLTHSLTHSLTVLQITLSHSLARSCIHAMSLTYTSTRAFIHPISLRIIAHHSRCTPTHPPRRA